MHNIYESERIISREKTVMRRLDRSELEIIIFFVGLSYFQDSEPARLFCALGGVLTSRTSPPCMVTSDYSTLLSGKMDLRGKKKRKEKNISPIPTAFPDPFL